ncbi:MAG: hypothetical protein QM534_17595 [Sediminibacterium sp.]|nr:hypothetical protein [Sediminibacterium sp.]
MLTAIKDYCDALCLDFVSIPEVRKLKLGQLAAYIKAKLTQQEEVRLVYICTHNSRRSHFGQVWAKTAAAYYGIDNVFSWSGGTEATTFHPNAIKALERVGFVIIADGQKDNPHYSVKYTINGEPMTCYSKCYDDPANPSSHFAAVMTCGEAEQNCPFIPGAEQRIPLTYEDPKVSDGTPVESATYDERCRQIALETLYVFSVCKV